MSDQNKADQHLCLKRNPKADLFLSQYLLQQVGTWPRVRCPHCNASRQLYCCNCLKILAPPESWPPCILNGTLNLPFLLDIILDDRRVVSTGVQIATLLTSSLSSSQNRGFRMVDVELDEPIPNYDEEEDGLGTYLLFPGPSSIPLSSVLIPRDNDNDQTEPKTSRPRLRRLVILDCKWRSTSIRLHPTLSKLKKVHLDDPPSNSYYWRWHNSGEGMLSTVEAVYFAAWQVGTAWNWDEERLHPLVNLFWLFRHQRETIRHWYEHGEGQNHPAPLPFTEEGKEFNRRLRRQALESAECSEEL
jgi:DTW domain